MTLPAASFPADPVAGGTAAADPYWYRDAVVYQLNIKAFFDSNNDGIGDFKGVTAKLDYVKDLGVNTIWLMPFYPSPLRDDGYDISEYEDVHPQYGTLEDFRELLTESHKRGLRVITELVINHTSDQHPWFQAARNAPAGSPERDFYVWSDSDRKYPGTRIIFTDTEQSNWTWDPVAKAYFWHRFFSHQPDLNFDNPRVLDAVLRTMRFWLDLGVDGFRLDAIPYLVERDGTSNENLPETHEVIKKLRAAIDANYQNRFLLAEANMWPEDVREYFGDGDECQMAYHFPLMPRMYMAIAQENRYPIVEIMQQTPEIPGNCQWAIFLRNHDELTLEMVTSKERDYMYRMYAEDRRARINLGIRRRLAPLMENDIDRVKLMNAMLLSMPGSPIIYYGDEIGMGDNVFVGDRNGVRTPMQWTPDRNAGFSRADPQHLYLQPIMDAVFGYEALNVEAQMRDSSSLLNWTKRMLAVRKTSRAFGRGKRHFLKPGNRKILAYLTEYEGDIILCVFNLSRAAQPVELDLSVCKGRVPVEMLGRTSFPPISNQPYLLTIPSFGFYWFQLAIDAQIPHWHQEAVALQDRMTLVLFDGWTSFIRDRVMPWRIGMADRLRTQFETDALPRYIESQRWYGSSGAVIERVRLVDHAIWNVGKSSWMLPMLSLDRAAEVTRCFLPLVLAWEDHDELLVDRVRPSAVAKVRQQANVGLMGDAFLDEEFCRAVVIAMGKGLQLKTDSGLLCFKPTAAFGNISGDIASMAVSRPGAASGSAVVTLDESILLKGYRYLCDGVNAESEMGRYLTDEAQFAGCAPLLGTLEYVGNDMRVVSLALMQRFVPNQGDGFEYALGYVKRFLEQMRTAGGGLAGDAAGALHGGFLSLASVLGIRTAELHLALAASKGNAAFDPEPMLPGDVAAWTHDATVAAGTMAALLRDRLSRLPPATKVAAQAVIDRQGVLQKKIVVLGASIRPTVKTRFHGSYGLGQVLVTGNDFVIVGFGGEAAGVAAKRRISIRSSPLRDVATMLRSFDGVRWAAQQQLTPDVDEIGQLESAAQQWLAATRTAFISAYATSLTRSGRADWFDANLIALFELEMRLIDVCREIESLPDCPPGPLLALRQVIDDAIAPQG